MNDKLQKQIMTMTGLVILMRSDDGHELLLELSSLFLQIVPNMTVNETGMIVFLALTGDSEDETDFLTDMRGIII